MHMNNIHLSLTGQPKIPNINEDVKISIAPEMSVCHEYFTSGKFKSIWCLTVAHKKENLIAQKQLIKKKK